jgi:isochorismate hydrolase
VNKYKRNNLLRRGLVGDYWGHGLVKGIHQDKQVKELYQDIEKQQAAEYAGVLLG